MNQRALQRHLRRLSWLAAGLGLFYLYWRYDFRTLPAEGCSPLLRFVPGDSLLLDTRPPGYAPGDALLFRVDTPEGAVLHLGLVEATEPEGAPAGAARALWVVTDAPDCPGEDSSTLGWIALEDCRARVLFAWPW